MDDAAQIGLLLDQVVGAVALFVTDGACDQSSVRDDVAQRHPDAAVVVPPRATAAPNETAESAPTQHDRHLQCVEPRGSPDIAEHGRVGWQKRSGYNPRARAEAGIARWEQVVGNGLGAKDECRATEVEVGVYALDRMLALGRPISMHTA